MPEIDRTTYGSVKLRYDQGGVSVYDTSRVIGFYQKIEPRNLEGSFQPGVMRINPVVIEKHMQTSTPASVGKGAAYGHTCEVWGDCSAYCVSNFNLRAQSQSRASWDQDKAEWSMNKALAKAGAPELDVGVILGELKETLIGIAQPLSAFRKWLLMWRSFKLHGAKLALIERTHLDMLTGSYLEFWYGVYPLIKTIDDIILQLQSGTNARLRKLERVTGSVKWTKQDYLYTGVNQGLYLFGNDTRFWTEYKTSTKVYFQLEVPLTFAQRYGIDLPAWPSVGYELLTLSFVWDWFFGIGNWLKATQLTLNPNRIILGTCTSQRTTVTAESNLTFARFYGTPVGEAGIKSSHRSVYERLERRTIQSLPQLPAVNWDWMSVQRIFAALSLIWQRLPKPTNRRR